MTDDAMTEWREGLRYRILYGFACRFLEGANPAACTREGVRKVRPNDILAEVVHAASIDRADDNAMELAREAVEDAREGRQPRW